jgi:sialidase-1
MPENMTGKYVNACNGEVLISRQRNVDGMKAICHSSSVPLSARRDSVASSTRVGSRDDYSTPERLGNNWMKDCVLPRVVMLFDDGGHGQRPHRLPL